MKILFWIGIIVVVSFALRLLNVAKAAARRRDGCFRRRQPKR
jgi:hypothetical protein